MHCSFRVVLWLAMILLGPYGSIGWSWEVFVEPPAEKGAKTAALRDSIDARIPKDPKVESLWDVSQMAVKDRNWKQVIDLQQKLLDYPEDALIESAPGRWESVRTAANRVLQQAPAEVLDDYEQQYGGLAQQLLLKAQGPQTVERLVEVASRYLQTKAGATAAARLAAWHFDQREFIPATQWNRELLERGWSGTADLRWKLQAALAARYAGVNDLQPFLKGWFETAQETRLTLGDQSRTVREWWEQSGSPLVTAPQPKGWTQFGGSNLRWAKASPEEPMLLRNWGRSLYSSNDITRRLQQLIRDINDQRLPMIPAGSPIVVGDKVAYRDLRGVLVVDRQTGKALWRTEEGISPERILNGVPSEGQGSDNAWRVRLGASQFDDEYFGESAEMHPLASWLFRDATNAFISTDGQRLYVLEDVAVMTRHQSGYFGDDDPDVADPFGATWSSNRLSAYDLNTGRLVWTIGGPASTEAVALPLAGAFFFGVPAIDRDELYVVASTGQEIRLQALDPETGRPRWSQLLAFSDTKIELDIPRRWLSAPVAIHEGLIICPTTVGWIVAVDRTRRSIAWAQRYLPKSDDPELDPASQFLSQRSLNETWSVGSPLISGNAVLVATPEVDQLLCFDLLDGKLRWSRDRKDGLYLATATAEAVIVVGQTDIQARSLADGRKLWLTEWDTLAQPSGRGVRLGDTLAIPISPSNLAIIDIKSGQLLQSLPMENQSLGNLVKVGHQFFSFGWNGCQAFSEKSKFLQELAEEETQHPQAAGTILHAARYALFQNNPSQVIALLTPSSSTGWSSQDIALRDQLLWQSYQRLADAQPGESDRWLKPMQELAQSPQRQLELLALQVDSLTAADQAVAAFELLWSTALKLPSTAQTVTRPDAPHIETTPAVWIAGRLQSLWSASQNAERATLDALLTRQIDTALAGSLEDQQKIWPWVKFHPAAIRLCWATADPWARAHYLAHAETLLRTGLSHPDLGTRLETELKLARLMQSTPLFWDDAPHLKALMQQHGDVRLPSGETFVQAIESERLLQSKANPVSVIDALHRQQPLNVVRLPAGHQPTVQELISPESSPYFGTVSFQLEPDDQRIVFREQQQGRLLGIVPLRTLAQSEDTGYSPYRFFGPRLLLLHRNVLQMISPAEQRVLWSVSVGHQRGIDWEGHRPEPATLQETDDYYDEPGGYWHLQQHDDGRLVFANDVGIGVLEQRGVAIYDPGTGLLRWRHTGMPPYAQVIGTAEVVVVIDPQGEELKTFRTSDGQPLDIPDLSARLKRAIAIFDNDLITVQTKPGLQIFALDTRQLAIQRQDLLTGDVRWNVEIRNGSQLGQLGQNSMLIVGPAKPSLQNRHSVERLDFEQGKLQTFDPVPIAQSAESLLPLVDAERLYLIINDNDYSDNYGDSLQSAHVDGLVVCWNRQTGQMLWRTQVDEQNLILDRFSESPALVFLSREWKQVAQASYTKLRLLALDKVTGSVRLSSESPSLFGGFHGMKVLPRETGVELISYNLRLQLLPGGDDTAATAETQSEEATAPSEGQ